MIFINEGSNPLSPSCDLMPFTSFPKDNSVFLRSLAFDLYLSTVKWLQFSPWFEMKGVYWLFLKLHYIFFNSVSFPYFSHKLHFVCNFSVLQTMAGYWAEIFFELSTATIGSFSWEIIANFKTSSIWENSSKFSFDYEWQGFFPKD